MKCKNMMQLSSYPLSVHYEHFNTFPLSRYVPNINLTSMLFQ